MGELTIGLDLGQLNDATALAVVETNGDELHLRHLERWRGVAYPEQVRRVGLLVGNDVVADRAREVVVDGTGVGVAVVDMLRPVVQSAGAPLVVVTITGGDTVAGDERSGFRVPKRDLVGAAQVALQAGRLKIAAGLPESDVLIRELLSFKVSISARGHDSYSNGSGWRDAEHDDLVLALALAVWRASAPTEEFVSLMPDRYF